MSDDLLIDKRILDASGVFLVFLVILLIINSIICSGCMGITTESAKTTALDAISPVIVLKGSAQYERMYPSTPVVPTAIPTPLPSCYVVTPTSTPAIQAHEVNPYSTGKRWEKMWFRHILLRKPNPLSNASPLKPCDLGVVIYDHRFMNSYTWWSDADGQYYKELPKPGYRFLFIWVHEELFGDPKTNLVIMPGFGQDAFIVQYKNSMYYNDTSYNPVHRILEFDQKPDYYSISRTSTFGYTRIFIGRTYKYGGWIAEENYDLYIGQGNAWDGYIVYQVPVSATDREIALLGNFGAWGNAYWSFSIYD